MMKSCSLTKKIFQKGDHLRIKRIAVQRIVPGMPEPPPYDQLSVQVEKSNSELKLDSVYFQNRVFVFSSTIPEEIELKSSRVHNDTNYEGESNTAFIFYHLKGKNYYESYNDVMRLEDLVMP